MRTKTHQETQIYRPSSAQRPKPAPHKRNWLPWIIGGGTLFVGFSMVFGVIALVALLYFSQPRIASGVSVAGLSIGGKSAEAAGEYLAQNLANPSITSVDGDRRWLVTLADLGISIDIDSTLQAAEDSVSDLLLQPRYIVDLGQAQNGLINLSELVNIEPAAGQMGRAIDIPVVLDRLRVDITGELADNIIELDMIDIEPPESDNVNTLEGTITHIVEKGQELGLIAREYGVDIEDIVSLNDISDPDLLYIGQELIIPAGGVYTPSAAEAPAAPTPVGKSIVVSNDKQRIYAYENGQLIRSHLVSTGLPATPTVLGDYKIYVKYVADDMSGPGYFLPQVPYTMYFYQGYGIHGTYWHNSFGRQMSHGCVNLPTDEAQWFFNWAEVGTPVRVIA
jgi:L,D-transpeptidase catalytic domain/LysM domain